MKLFTVLVLILMYSASLIAQSQQSQRAKIVANKKQITQSVQQSLSELVRLAKPSVVSISIFDSDDKLIATGSGFFLTPSLIITNKHVIETASRAEIKTSDGQKYSVQSIAGVKKDIDLALLKINSNNLTIKTPVVTKNFPLEGDDIFVLGNPRGLEWSVSTGIVSAIRLEENSEKFIQITAPISPGSSGSPVFNMRGEIIGVATASVTGGQNLNLAIPSEQILLIPRNSEISLADFSNETAAKNHQLSEEIRLEGREIGRRRDISQLEKCSLEIPYYQKAIGIYRQNAKAWYDLSFCLNLQGKIGEAIEAINHSIDLAENKNVIISDEGPMVPQYREEILFLAHHSRGELYIDNRNPLLAEKELETMKELLIYSRNNPLWEYWVNKLTDKIKDYSPK